ncbi:hypothetical protein BayCH28_11800 [Mycolicibacterium sp. CH28]|nr:hypothetical protein BayCH28_11800 [Mycolicibacterium sp. CH28]
MTKTTSNTEKELAPRSPWWDAGRSTPLIRTTTPGIRGTVLAVTQRISINLPSKRSQPLPSPNSEHSRFTYEEHDGIEYGGLLVTTPFSSDESCGTREALACRAGSIWPKRLGANSSQQVHEIASREVVDFGSGVVHALRSTSHVER